MSHFELGILYSKLGKIILVYIQVSHQCVNALTV